MLDIIATVWPFLAVFTAAGIGAALHDRRERRRRG